MLGKVTMGQLFDAVAYSNRVSVHTVSAVGAMAIARIVSDGIVSSPKVSDAIVSSAIVSSAIVSSTFKEIEASDPTEDKEKPA